MKALMNTQEMIDELKRVEDSARRTNEQLEKVYITIVAIGHKVNELRKQGILETVPDGKAEAKVEIEVVK